MPWPISRSHGLTCSRQRWPSQRPKPPQRNARSATGPQAVHCSTLHFQSTGQSLRVRISGTISELGVVKVPSRNRHDCESKRVQGPEVFGQKCTCSLCSSQNMPQAENRSPLTHSSKYYRLFQYGLPSSTNAKGRDEDLMRPFISVNTRRGPHPFRPFRAPTS